MTDVFCLDVPPVTLMFEAMGYQYGMHMIFFFLWFYRPLGVSTYVSS